MFRTAHAIALSNKPYSDFKWMCQLDQIKGLDLGSTYHNDKSCRVFIKAIAMTEREKIKTEVQSSDFVSILCDGSTDAAIIDNEIVYIRYVSKTGPKVTFLGCMQVSKADAKGIFNAIVRACELNGICWQSIVTKLVALGCDGASVMLGSKGGVAALMKRENSAVVPVHCFGHR